MIILVLITIITILQYTHQYDNACDDLLLKVASIEQMSSHPAARVITQKGKETFGSSLLTTPSNFHEIAGAGVEGDINGDHITVGSQSLFEKNDNNKYHIRNNNNR